MRKEGVFITFEGADGSGKTTQISLLDEYLCGKKRKTLLTREPGAGMLGARIRELLLNYEGHISPNCESFLFLADRAQHVDNMIKPALADGKIVLCDRYVDSTIAYQGYGRQLDLDRILFLNNLATSNLKPDLTIVFDVDVETAFSRIGNVKDRMESEGKEFFNRVRNGYLEIAKQEPDRVKVLDSSASIEVVHKRVVALVESL